MEELRKTLKYVCLYTVRGKCTLRIRQAIPGDWGWGMSYDVWSRLKAIAWRARGGKWSLTND